jgi:hypothetical protein
MGFSTKAYRPAIENYLNLKLNPVEPDKSKKLTTPFSLSVVFFSRLRFLMIEVKESIYLL